MAIRYSIEKHVDCYPSKMLAQTGGKHLYNILLEADTDNGVIIARSDYVELDLYKAKASADVALIVREQMPNGNWLVEVTAPGDGVLIYQVPVIAEEYTRDFKDLANYYNPKGIVARGYEMAIGDTFEISDKGFDGTPEAGKACTVDATSHKIKITAATGGGTDKE